MANFATSHIFRVKNITLDCSLIFSKKRPAFEVFYNFHKGSFWKKDKILISSAQI